MAFLAVYTTLALVYLVQGNFYLRGKSDGVNNVVLASFKLNSAVACALRCSRKADCGFAEQLDGVCTLYREKAKENSQDSAVWKKEVHVNMHEMLTQVNEELSFDESKLDARDVCDCLMRSSKCKYFASCPGGNPDWLLTSKPSSYGKTDSNITPWRNMNSFTVCAWVRYAGSTVYKALNYIFSYTEKSDDDCDDISIYGIAESKESMRLYVKVGGKEFSTPVILYIHWYYHLCVVWRSYNGNLTTYVNGKVEHEVADVHKGELISSHGKVRIGIGVLSNQATSALKCMIVRYKSAFNGQIAQVNFWLDAVEAEDIYDNIFERCSADVVPFSELMQWGKTTVQLAGTARWKATCF